MSHAVTCRGAAEDVERARRPYRFLGRESPLAGEERSLRLRLRQLDASSPGPATPEEEGLPRGSPPLLPPRPTGGTPGRLALDSTPGAAARSVAQVRPEQLASLERADLFPLLEASSPEVRRQGRRDLSVVRDSRGRSERVP